MYRFRPTKPAFFLRGAQELGRDLLGRVLLHETPSGTLSAIIVETEAYDETDPASHSCHGRTDRNLCRGPGRLCLALGLGGTQNGVNMITSTHRFS